MDHATRAVLAQRQVNGAPGDVRGFAPLLANLELTGAVVTADAPHTHADAAEFLLSSKQADYLFMVNANHPLLGGRCARWAWHRVPVLDRTAGSSCAPQGGLGRWGSGSRTARRSSRSPARPATWAPGGGGPWSSTRLGAWPTPGPAPARLADLLGGHWAIENGLD
jgi:hypothetical protein